MLVQVRYGLPGGHGILGRIAGAVVAALEEDVADLDGTDRAVAWVVAVLPHPSATIAPRSRMKRSVSVPVGLPMSTTFRQWSRYV